MMGVTVLNSDSEENQRNIALVKGAGDAAECNDFINICLITKELAYACNSICEDK